MADSPFAPVIPQNQMPSYVRLPHSIDQPGPDTSTKDLLDTLGTAVSDSVKIADQHTKTGIDEDVHSGMDDLQYQKNQDIATTYNAVTKGTVADSEGNPVNLKDLFSKPDEDKTPDDLKNIDQIVKNLRVAKDHGQYSDTYYRMQVDKFAKEQRARHPGYRDYIDAKIKGEEGSTANELASSMIQDLNAALKGTKDATNKLETKALDNLKYPEVSAAYMNWKAGKIGDNDLVSTISRNLALDHGLANQQTMLTLNSAQRQADADKQYDLSSKQINHIFLQSWNVMDMGMGGEWGTPQKALDEISRRMATNTPFSTAELQQIRPLFFAAKNMYMKKSTEYGNTVVNPDADPKDQKTIRQVLGEKRFSELQTNGMSQMTELEKAYFNSDYGLIGTGKATTDAKVQDVAGNLTKDYPSFAQLAAVNKYAGPQAAKDVVSVMLGNPNGLSSEAKEWSKSKSVKAILNPANHLGVMPPGSGVTPPSPIGPLSSTVDEAIAKGYGGEAVRDHIDTLKKVFTAKETTTAGVQAQKAAQGNLIDYMYGTGNQSLFDKIPDSTKTIKGQKVPGRMEVYGDLSDRKILEPIHDSGIQNWTIVKDSLNNWSTYLIRGPVKTLSNLQQTDLNSDLVDISYNKETHSFVARPKALDEVYKGLSGSESEVAQKKVNARLTYPTNAMMAVRIAEGAIGPINKVLKSYVDIAEIEHSDPEGYIAKQLAQMGYSPAPGKNSPLIDAMRKAYPATKADEPIKPTAVKTEPAALPPAKKEEIERAPTSPASNLSKEDQAEYDRLREKNMKQGYLVDEDAAKWYELHNKMSGKK